VRGGKREGRGRERRGKGGKRRTGKRREGRGEESRSFSFLNVDSSADISYFALSLFNLQVTF